MATFDGYTAATTVSANDLLLMLDVDDPTQAAGGTTKNLTLTQTAAAVAAIQIDATASDIANTGPQAAGSVGKMADAGHVHYSSGMLLCTPTQYAPVGQVIITTLSATMASLNAAATTVAAGSNGGTISAIASWATPSAGVLAVANTAGWPSAGTINVAASGPTTAVVTYTGVTATTLTGCAYVSGSPSGTVATGGAVTLTVAGAASAVPNISTGSFVAPASGSVTVKASFIGQTSATGSAVAFGLCAHGTLTPIVGYLKVVKEPGATLPFSHELTFYVTGLTPGTSYNYDLMFAIASGGTYSVYVTSQTSTGPNLSNSGAGSPILMTVQGV